MGLELRDDNIPPGWVVEDGELVPWWYSREGTIIKWTIFLVPLTLFLGWLILGRVHAKRRMKRGLPLLSYHRCLVNRGSNGGNSKNDMWPRPMYGEYHPQPYHMNDVPPPPMYDPRRPPIYKEEGYASKVAPRQGLFDTNVPFESGPVSDYAPPPGPPPAVAK